MTQNTRFNRTRQRGCRCLRFLALGCLSRALPAAGQAPTPDHNGRDCCGQLFPCVGRPSFGLVAGTTVTPAHRLGFIGAVDPLAVYEEGTVQ